VICAEVDRLHEAARMEVPEVQPVTIPVREQILGDQPVLELRRQPPLARDHVVVRNVPPEVVAQPLVAALQLPAPENLERLAVEQEDPWDTVSPVGALAAESADVDALRPAVHSVWPGVAGPADQLLRFDHLD